MDNGSELLDSLIESKVKGASDEYVAACREIYDSPDAIERLVREIWERFQCVLSGYSFSCGELEALVSVYSGLHLARVYPRNAEDLAKVRQTVLNFLDYYENTRPENEEIRKVLRWLILEMGQVVIDANDVNITDFLSRVSRILGHDYKCFLESYKSRVRPEKGRSDN